MRVFFISEKSKFLVPSARKLAIVRGALPKVKGGGGLKTEVSNQRSTLGFWSDGLRPSQWGRRPGTPNWESGLLALVTPSTLPRASVVIPFTCQPPNTRPTQPLVRYRLPGPTGNSQIYETTKRWGVSR